MNTVVIVVCMYTIMINGPGLIKTAWSVQTNGRVRDGDTGCRWGQNVMCGIPVPKVPHSVLCRGTRMCACTLGRYKQDSYNNASVYPANRRSLAIGDTHRLLALSCTRNAEKNDG
jgi:hypothetical protein